MRRFGHDGVTQMGALSELTDMARDYGLGMKYFVMVGGALAALMLALFLWGRVETPEATADAVTVTAPAAVPPETPAATGAPTSY